MHALDIETQRAPDAEVLRGFRSILNKSNSRAGDVSMIDPICHGESLVMEMRETRPEPGTLALWWLGQSGYLITSRFGTLVIDPYLSEHLTRKYEGTSKPHIRMTRAPVRGADLRGVDLVLASHKHSD